MKKIYYLPLIIFLFSLTTFGQLEKNAPNQKGAVYCSQKKILNQNITTYPYMNAAAIQHAFNVLDYKIYLDLYNCYTSPYPKNYKANVTVKFSADSTLNYITLNAINNSLQIDSVSMDGASFTHSSDVLKVNLARTFAVGEVGNVKIYFQHKNVSDNAFYVSGGFVFTDCEPEGARFWFPCWDKPSDKATLDLTARVPATVKLGSNGRLADSTKTQDTIYYHWVSADQIATYLINISSKVNYNLDLFYWLRPSTGEQVPLRFYYNSGETVAPYRTSLLNMISYYSSTFTEHPFEKNGFAALNSQFSWGGMENQTLTTICPNCWSDNLLSHEFAHQWFGDMITCETWADIWLNEGFATFIEALWLEHTSGYSSYKSDINSDASSYLSGNPGWAISVPSWAITTPNTNTLFNYSITYAKGACVVHQLRYVLGDTVFFNFLKSYANDPQFRFNSCTIAKFNAKLNTFTGQNYNWFFDEWIFQPNHPTYTNKYCFFQDGSNWVTGFQAVQTNSYFYRMPIVIKVTYSDATSDTYRVDNYANNQMFFFSSIKQPTSVTFDPNNDIVLKSATLTQVSPFPVELTSFTSKADGNIVTLNWSTATEINNKGFEIYAAKFNDNGRLSDYEKVGFVKGNGSTTSAINYSFTTSVKSYGKYAYKLKQVDFDGSYTYTTETYLTAGFQPVSIKLLQNYPNPFNPQTMIEFELPKDSHVRLAIYNSLGQFITLLTESDYTAGKHNVAFDASNLSSGMYIYELKAGNTIIRNKMMLQK